MKELVIKNVDIAKHIPYDEKLNGYSYSELVEGAGPMKPGNLLHICREGAKPEARHKALDDKSERCY